MLNNVCLQGNIGGDLELKVSSSGISSVNFQIAVKRNYKDSEGKYGADWISCVAFRGTAEFICKYFRKGDMIVINGSLQTSEYTKDGKKTYRTEVRVDGANFGGAKNGGSSSEVKENTEVPPEAEQSDASTDDYPF